MYACKWRRHQGARWSYRVVQDLLRTAEHRRAGGDGAGNIVSEEEDRQNLAAWLQLWLKPSTQRNPVYRALVYAAQKFLCLPAGDGTVVQHVQVACRMPELEALNLEAGRAALDSLAQEVDDDLLPRLGLLGTSLLETLVSRVRPLTDADQGLFDLSTLALVRAVAHPRDWLGAIAADYARPLGRGHKDLSQRKVMGHSDVRLSEFILALANMTGPWSDAVRNSFPRKTRADLLKALADMRRSLGLAESLLNVLKVAITVQQQSDAAGLLKAWALVLARLDALCADPGLFEARTDDPGWLQPPFGAAEDFLRNLASDVRRPDAAQLDEDNLPLLPRLLVQAHRRAVAHANEMTFSQAMRLLFCTYTQVGRSKGSSPGSDRLSAKNPKVADALRSYLPLLEDASETHWSTPCGAPVLARQFASRLILLATVFALARERMSHDSSAHCRREEIVHAYVDLLCCRHNHQDAGPMPAQLSGPLTGGSLSDDAYEVLQQLLKDAALHLDWHHLIKGDVDAAHPVINEYRAANGICRPNQQNASYAFRPLYAALGVEVGDLPHFRPRSGAAT